MERVGEIEAAHAHFMGAAHLGGLIQSEKGARDREAAGRVMRRYREPGRIADQHLDHLERAKDSCHAAGPADNLLVVAAEINHPDGAFEVKNACGFCGDVLHLVAAALGLDIGRQFAEVLRRAAGLAHIDTNAAGTAAPDLEYIAIGDTTQAERPFSSIRAVAESLGFAIQVFPAPIRQVVDQPHHAVYYVPRDLATGYVIILPGRRPVTVIGLIGPDSLRVRVMEYQRLMRPLERDRS